VTTAVTSERDMWRLYRENTKEEQRLCVQFRSLFPRGHRTTLRPLVAALGARVSKDVPGCRFGGGIVLADMHPRAYAFLVRHGRDYVPRRWEMVPEAQPMFGACYGNAWALMCNTDTAYVEGVAVGALVRPMLHAWNAATLDSRRAVDWTHYAGSHWTRYLGCAFTKSEYDELLAATSHAGATIIGLFHARYFADIEGLMERIIARRSA